MNLLIVGPESDENKMLVKEAKIRKHKVSLISIKEISFIIRKNKMELFGRNRIIKDYDVCLLRGIKPYFAKVQALAEYLSIHKVRVVDSKLAKKSHNFSKIFSAVEMVNNNVPVIDTFIFSTVKKLQDHMNKLSEKIVVKDVMGMQSRNIFRMKKEDLMKFFKKEKINNYLIQPELDANYYYRVFVVGKKVLGAMKRISFFNPERKKYKLKDRSQKGVLNSEIKKLALRAAEAADIEIAGVDIIFHKNKKYVLEVNRSPQFKRFVSVVGVNVAKEIIKYLEKQNRKVDILTIK